MCLLAISSETVRCTAAKFCMQMHACLYVTHGPDLMSIRVIVMIYFHQINTISPYQT